MNDESAIRNVIAQYFHHLDDRDYDAWAELLHEHCTIYLYDDVMDGREAARANISARQVADHKGKHLALNISVDVQGERASALCDYFYVVGMGTARHRRYEVLNIGRYKDQLVKAGDEWLFLERRIEVDANLD